MSIFILGVLTGWLIEWLVYHFWWKEHKEKLLVASDTNKPKEKQEVSKTISNPDHAPTKKKEETARVEVVSKDPSVPDDLTQLFGVGPGYAKSFQKAGINSFKQLSELSLEALEEKLFESKVQVLNKTIAESWVEQAKLLDTGDLEGLKVLQDKLKQ